MRCTSPLYRVNRGEFVPPYITRKIYGYKQYLHFINNLGVDSSLFTRINCGQCLSCRINKAREWAERCYLESKMYPSSYFVTLTYNDEHLNYAPCGMPTLKKRDIQLFIKRLRKWCDKSGKPSPRYFATGEYGEKNFRPHYHMILFNIEIEDLTHYRTVKRGNDIYIYENSCVLEKLWHKGFVVISKVVPETCAYTAQYSLKKVGMMYSTGYAKDILLNECSSNEKRFNALCSLGEVLPPFNIQSTKPGIGGAFASQNLSEILETDAIPGCKIKAIRYFDKLMERENPVRLEEIKQLRADACDLQSSIYGEKQFEVREDYVLRRNKLRRSI